MNIDVIEAFDGKSALMKKVVLAGATGLVGGMCLKILLDSPQVESVISLTRRPTATVHPKLKELTVEFSSLSSLPRDLKVAAVFCGLGTTIKKAGSQAEFQKVDLDYVISLAVWGIKHHASHFLVVSAMGANPKSLIFYNKIKGNMEAAVSTLGYPSVDIFRPSLLLGKRKEVRMGEQVGEKVMGIFAPMMKGPLEKYRPIEAEVVARAMVNRGLHPKAGTFIHDSAEVLTLGS